MHEFVFELLANLPQLVAELLMQPTKPPPPAEPEPAEPWRLDADFRRPLDSAPVSPTRSKPETRGATPG